MGYVVVVAAALAVGVAVYVVTLRRSTASDTRSFDYPGSEVSGGPRRSTGVTYVPVAAGLNQTVSDSEAVTANPKRFLRLRVEQ